MRDPKRIDEILNELREVWMANPDLRLGQLVVNVVKPKEPTPEVFYIEDDEFRGRLRFLSTEEQKMQIKPIKTSAEHLAVLSEISELMDAKLGTPEGERLTALAAIVEAFEIEKFPIELKEGKDSNKSHDDSK